MTPEHHTDPEVRIRAAMQQLLGGNIPEGLKCDIKSLSTLSGVPRATIYRTYPHLKAEFVRQRTDAHDAGQQPDPRVAQIEHLKTEINDLHARLSRRNTHIAELQDFKTTALSRITAQHDELTNLRREHAASTSTKIRRLNTPQSNAAVETR